MLCDLVSGFSDTPDLSTGRRHTPGGIIAVQVPQIGTACRHYGIFCAAEITRRRDLCRAGFHLTDAVQTNGNSSERLLLPRNLTESPIHRLQGPAAFPEEALLLL